MSFEEQERVLLDLIFDSSLRKHFRNDVNASLAQYDLEEDEINDFKSIKPDALELDARLRTNLLLSHISRAFPITFTLVSSLTNGLDLLKKLIDIQTMRTPPIDRTSVYGNRLREQLTTLQFEPANEQALIIAILEAELGMAWTSATLKRATIENTSPDEEPALDKSNWASRPIKLAEYVSAAMIPQSYAKLKQQLCKNMECDLWTQLNKKPLAAARRNKILSQEDPRLFITRAYVSHPSQCEPTIDHKTVELSEGFAPLFQHVNGTASIDQILTQFKQAGAPEQILQSVRTGFKQLVDENMLCLV